MSIVNKLSLRNRLDQAKKITFSCCLFFYSFILRCIFFKSFDFKININNFMAEFIILLKENKNTKRTKNGSRIKLLLLRSQIIFSTRHMREEKYYLFFRWICKLVCIVATHINFLETLETLFSFYKT